MNDVAKRAGVHHSTVSRALSNSRKISEETRQKVLKAVEELGYRPNPYISILMRHRSQRKNPTAEVPLALVTTHPTRTGCIEEFPLLEPAFAAAKHQAKSRGFQLEEIWAPLDKTPPERLSRVLYARNISGILLAPFPRPTAAYELDWARFAVVAWGMGLENRKVHRVRANHFGSVSRAMDECHKLGYRRVGLVMNLEGNVQAGEHYEAAYLLKQREHKVEDPPNSLLMPLLARDMFMRWFEKERPDAILVERRPFLIGWLAEVGLRVPEDVGVASLICHPEDHPLSGIWSNWSLQAITGINFLIDLLAHNSLGLHETPTTLMVDSGWNPGRTLRRVNVENRCAEEKVF